ncbi:serine hydrolase domain-containing protein [Silvibacterium acidisoli]|uniref:serine hydrolase domain-containing protein n=1 Tax=Acidobacteriaceae bacterium ZG23-2 TaxID=2883246 RepID=UPI00406D422D
MTFVPASVPRSAVDGVTRFAAARAVLEEAVRNSAFPGASYGVLAGNEIVALDSVGRFTYDEDSPVVLPGTVFDLASVTKVLATTSMAMILHDHHVLHLDARLGDILPGFVIGMAPGSGKHHVTLRMLLAHSSGLPGYARLFEHHPTPEGMIRAVLQLPLEAAPGTRAEYSDIGFILLGKALEVLAGDFIARLFRMKIAEPLGLRTARYCPPNNWRTHIAPTEHDMKWRHRILQGEVQDENCWALGGASGHAGVFADALDLLRFAQCILNGGKAESGRQIFSPETIQLFAQREKNPSGTTRALGWDTPSRPESSSGQYFSDHSIGHLGYAGTSLWIDREKNIAAVLLTNRTWPDRVNQAIKEVRPAFYNAVMKALF